MPALSALDGWLRRHWWALVVGLLAVGAGAGFALATHEDDTATDGRGGGEPAVIESCDVAADGVVDLLLDDGEVLVLARGTDGAILVNDAPCGSADVRSVEVILVQGTEGDEEVVVDLGGGALGPGASGEADGSPEIELRIDLGEGLDAFRVLGSEEADVLEVGDEGINLNAGEARLDPDVTLLGVEDLTLDGRGGDDIVRGSLAGAPAGRPVRLLGGTGNDTLSGGGSDDTILGGDGDDILASSAGNDRLFGERGVDTVDYSAEAAGIVADLVEEVVSKPGGQDAIAGIEGVTTGAGDDILIGDDAGNLLSGGLGDDTLEGGRGDDVLVGGAGTDTADFGSASGTVVVDLAAGTATGSAGEDQLTEIETLIGGVGDDTLVGDREDNTLRGGAGDDDLRGGGGGDALEGEAGDDRLRGGAGGDALIGGPGGDLLDGGAGVDTADYRSAPRGIAVDLGDGSASADGEGASDDIAAIERVLGTTSDDTLVGDGDDNRLEGGDGDDEISGGAGDDDVLGGPGDDLLGGGFGEDAVRGGPGDDELSGGADDDDLDGGRGTDTADYSEAPGSLVVDLGAGVAFRDGDGATDQIDRISRVVGGDADDSLTGDDGDNELIGGDGDDLIDGLAGDDDLQGGAGDDDLQGGAGDDDLRGDAGDDRLEGRGGDDRLEGGTGTDVGVYRRAAAGAVVDLSTGRGTDGDGGTDALEDVENLEGSRFNDVLTGTDGDSRLVGLGGLDVLRGRAGDDLLIGGAGPDDLDGGEGLDECRGGEGPDTFTACEVALQ